MRRFIFVFMLLTLGVVGYSQGMYFDDKQRKNSGRYLVKTLKELNLTPQQKRYIANILKESRDKVKEIEKQIFELRMENYEILRNYPPDKKKFLTNQEKISDLLKQIHIIRAEGYINILSVLDSEQYRIFIDRMRPKFKPPFDEEKIME